MRSEKGIYEKYIKRPQDFILSFLAIIVLSPVLFITWLLVRVKLGTPAIFKQNRPGLNEKIFTLYKFRTMTNKKDSLGKLLPDEKRLTHFGKCLRATSLDELPELFNILKGDMAIVGPRPLLVSYLSLYNEEQAERHSVRPGLTGYAQAHGRNLLTWEDKFKMDVEYAHNISFIGDWKIIFDTIGTVLRRDGISSETTTTMEPFTGTKRKDETN